MEENIYMGFIKKYLYRKLLDSYAAGQPLIYYIVITLAILSYPLTLEKCLANDEDIPWHIHDKAIQQMGFHGSAR